MAKSPAGGPPRDFTLLQCKVESEYALYLDRYTGQLGWLENPLSRSLQRRFAKQRVPTDNLRIDDASLLRDRHLDLHLALGASCFGDRLESIWIVQAAMRSSSSLVLFSGPTLHPVDGWRAIALSAATLPTS